ncbi:metaxin-1 [Nematostella vectensis]|uniref:metaxin-1 n=1 Tax=Nematostella vectensis TaxID=45351 RepID=UPI002077867C|nr:metaxin-1 [Nematostella vectensis]XP_048583754.1 metaxin-1 [Nematostella vectensis]XP_048583755.1 metaxin-1 [Nematostella vectensis]
MADVLELFSWPGDFGLPSVDIPCLAVLSYAKFAGCPLKVNRSNKFWKSPTWEFPVMKSGEEMLTSPYKIMDHLRQKNFNADYQLTAKQGADTLAFIALIEDKLLPAMHYTLWVDSKNYVEFTRPMYARKLPLPLNFFVPGRIANQKKLRIGHKLDPEEEEANGELENMLFKEAIECLTHLSVLLGDKDFFFGESPTTLDAVVFAHLALIWRAPSLPNNKLANYLKGYDNLYNFCGRILQRYFPPDPEDPQQYKPSPTHPSLDEDPYQKRKMWLSVGIAVVAMVTYAVLSGLVQIEYKKDEKQETGDDELLPDVMSFQYQDERDDE